MDFTEDQIEQLMQQNQHAFALRDKIAEIVTGSNLVDIETAFLLIICKTMVDNLDETQALDEAARACARMVMMIKFHYQYDRDHGNLTLQ